MAEQRRYQRLQSGDSGSDQQGKSNKDIYCEALATTLQGITPPVMVGFYAPWGRKKRRLLDNVEDHLEKRQNDPGTVKAGGICSKFPLLFRIILFDPVKPKEPDSSNESSEHHVRYIFIGFNTWEYVGCDYTWAGIVTTLLDKIEKDYKWCFAAFRCFGGDFQEKSNTKKWTLKTWTKILFWCVLFLCVLCFALFPLHYTVPFVIPGTALISILSTSAPILSKSFFTIKRHIQKEMNRKDLSTQLGFMHTVKKEVETMIKFLKILEFHEGQEIRVVLRITNLDLCAPDKVVSVLDAIKILLSDPAAPFISILAADPSILVRCINKSENTCRNSYLYLDRIVSLPFSLPPMNLKEKQQLLSEALEPQRKDARSTTEPKDTCIDVEVNETEAVKGLCKDSSVESLGIKNVKGKEEVMSRMAQNKETEGNDEIAGIRQSASELLKKNEYLPGNYVEMSRVVNTALTIQYMLCLGYEFDPPSEGNNTAGFEPTLTEEELIAWVILANSWPCRLSWLLQCEEDKRQRTSRGGGENRGADRNSSQTAGDGRGAADDGSESLLNIYEENRNHLERIKEKIRELLELDGDPDLFEKMLKENQGYFIARRARYIPNILINLDFSLKRKFELLEDLHNTYRRNNEHSSEPANSPDREPTTNK